jgi:hypothetical protein
MDSKKDVEFIVRKSSMVVTMNWGIKENRKHWSNGKSC